MNLITYICLFLTSSSLCILDKVKKAFLFKKCCFTGMILLLIIMSASKNEMTSWDTKNYIESYSKVPSLSGFTFNQFFYYEPGYMLLQSVCKQFTDSPLLLFSVISVISIGLYGSLIWQYSPYPFLSLFIYLCVFFYKNEMIIIRYGCSTAIMLLCLIRLSEKKIFKSILWAIISSLFHYTALTYIILLAFFLMIKKIKTMEFIIFISFPFAVVGVTLFQVVNFIYKFNILPPYFQGAFSKGMQYLTIQGNAGYKRILMYLPIVFFYRQCYKTNILKNSYFIILFALLMMIELNQVEIFGRIGQLYVIIIIVSFPSLLLNINRRYRQILYIYIIIYALYTSIRFSFFNTGGGVILRW